MANLAIKGHSTRGREVIALLKILGGINERFKFDGLNEEFIYYIYPEYNNDILSAIIPTDQIVFTLEQFQEKFPYKVGDKVIAYAEGCLAQFTIQDMRWNYELNKVEYKICSSWCDTSLIQPYKEETMEEKLIPRIDFNEYSKDKYLLNLGNYDIKEESGKTYAVRRKTQYPKTYEECCEVLGCKANDFFTDFSYNNCDVEVSDYEDKIDDLIQNFRKLRYCRDAYWKIAGEQMGLGKPWEPDWLNVEQDKYVLFTHNNTICSDCFILGHNILAFPTKEMRDAFKENFDLYIDFCKELL